MGEIANRGFGIIASIDEHTGYPMDENGHLLRRDSLNIGDTAPNLTAPYGLLRYAIGSAIDFVCMDYAVILGDHGMHFLVLHSVFDFEPTSRYEIIPDFQYDCQEFNIVEEAVRFYRASGIAHDTVGWNQDPLFFARSVFLEMFSINQSPPVFSETEKRFGGKKIDAFCRIPQYLQEKWRL